MLNKRVNGKRVNKKVKSKKSKIRVSESVLYFRLKADPRGGANRVTSSGDITVSHGFINRLSYYYHFEKF